MPFALFKSHATYQHEVVPAALVASVPLGGRNGISTAIHLKQFLYF
jgi:hypothetical protein